MRAVQLSRRAVADIDQELAHLTVSASASVAGRFLLALHEALDEVEEHPRIGVAVAPLTPTLDGLRRWQVAGSFADWLIFYRLDGDGVEVIRVLHGSRDIPAVFDPEA